MIAVFVKLGLKMNFNTPSALQNHLQELFDRRASQEEILVLLQENQTHLQNSYDKLVTIESEDGTQNYHSLLNIVILLNYAECVDLLLRVKIDINFPTFQGQNNNVSCGMSPLQTAAWKGEKKYVSQLLAAGADIFYSTGVRDVLNVCSSAACFDIIVNFARSNGLLNDLLNRYYKKPTDEHFCFMLRQNIDVVRAWMSLEELSVIGAKPFASLFLDIYLQAPNKDSFERYSALMSVVHQQFNAEAPTLAKPKVKEMKLPEAFTKVFGHNEMATEKFPPREAALKRALAETYALFNSYYQCMGYLEELEKAFKEWYLKNYSRDFPTQSEDLSYFAIDGIRYPFPPKERKKIKKDSSLQKYLVECFQQYGMAEKIFKWRGFVPQEIANDMIRNGYFIMEDYILAAVLHGKLTHMLQCYIVILAMNQNQIRTFYKNLDGTIGQLSPKEVIASLVTPGLFTECADTSLWALFFDTYLAHNLSFTNPSGVNSIVMMNQIKLPILSQYWRSTFYSSLEKSLVNYNTNGYQKLNSVTDYVTEVLQQIHPTIFIYGQAQFYANQAEQKNSSSILSFIYGDRYVIEEKRYGISAKEKQGEVVEESVKRRRIGEV